MINYDKIIEYWDKVFRETKKSPIKTASVGPNDLDKALDWLCQNSSSILDFGCGNGVMLFKCCLRGTNNHRGIDISEEGIKVAKEIQRLSEKEGFAFSVGGVEELETIADEAFDGVVLSNIIDNLIPQDAIKVLTEVKRILKIDGKVLVKLNPFLTDNQINEWNIKIIENNFLDDGLYLWNQSTEEWIRLLENYLYLSSEH
jgi:arsenite methyltransferase